MRYSQSLARSAKLSLAFSTTVAVLGSSAFAQILTTNDDTLTTYRAGVTAVQGLRPRPEQRGVNHDGSMRKASTHRLAVAGNPFERVWSGEAELNGVRLDTGTWTTSDVDISLPASSPWVVGRSYNARQDNSGHLASNGYQGFNWAQSSQPEIVLYEHASDDAQDVLYLVYGADRYAEFKRASSTANTYKGTNGAAGVFERTDASPDTWAYYAPDGMVATFFGFDTADADHKGQIWKVADPAGNVAYVGSTSSASAALSAGYDASGRITDAYDSAGRHFDYAYTGSAIGGVTRLESVIVTSGATEVARVEYGYYGTEAYGEAGDLKTVTTTTPLTDSGVNDIRVKYYRYWEGPHDHEADPPVLGHDHAIMLVLEAEGARRYDWNEGGAGEPEFDAGFTSASTATLKSYASGYFEYDTSRRIQNAMFAGNCGCGSAGSGSFALSYGTSGYTNDAGYDNEAARRTVVDMPDCATAPSTTVTPWITQYFDELGQALSRVEHDGDPSGSPTSWATHVSRDATGCVVTIGTPASVTTYTHSGWTITDGSAGLVRVYDRVASGEATGFLADELWREGSGGTEEFLKSHVWWTNKATKGFTSPTITLVRPLVKEQWEYPELGESQYGSTANKIDYDYTTYSGVSQPLALTTSTATEAAVSSGKNGDTGSGLTVATHYALDGNDDFNARNDGGNRIVRYKVRVQGLVTEIRNDADTSALSPPTNFDATGTAPIDETSTMSHDAQGRLTLSEDSGGRVSAIYHSVLADRRHVTLTFPRYEDLATDKYYGPVGYSVTNHAGKVEASGVIAVALAGSTVAPTVFIDESDADPITAVDTGSSFGSVAQLSVSIYDLTGTQVQEQRSYFVIPSSLPGTDGVHFDATSHGYDALGRQVRTLEPHGTIRRAVYDVRGRTVSGWVGTNDYSFDGGSGSGPDNMVKADETTFDSNGYVTGQTAFIQDSTTGQRETNFTNDIFGRPVVTERPMSPHSLTLYDNLGRVTGVGQYSSVSGLDADSDPTDDVNFDTNRLALSRTYYDERGRVWKSTRHEIDATDGSNDDNLETLTWYDRQNRRVKVDGEQLEKFAYDRLGRMTHRFLLAKVDGDEDTWAEALDVAGDHLLEEHQTTYDADGHEIMSARIERLYDDLGGGANLGLLDTNADSDALKYTAANVKGRIQITAKWYDAWDRLEEVVQYGTNDSANNAADFDRDGLSVPSRSATALRTSYAYNTDGTLQKTTDPKGIVALTEYDAMGRTTRVISNWVDGTAGGSSSDEDQVVAYGYTDGLQTSITADLPSPETDQVTTYTFGTTKGGSAGDSKIATGHLLRKVQYPDSSDATNDIVAFAYNAQGQQIWKRDQALSGSSSDYNIIETDYDDAGREIHRRVSQKRSITDGAVRRISTTYEALGRRELVTQYDDATVGSPDVVVDEVKYLYDGWGNLTDFRQDKDSSVGASGYWAVQYSYVKATGGRNTLRRDTITTPGGKFNYSYRTSAGFLDGDASRVSQISDDFDTALVTYQYNGAGSVVKTTLEEPELFSKLFTGTGTTFSGLDRFNRTIVSKWTKDLATDRDIYKVTVGYDENSNITSQDDAVHTGHDVKYLNDNLNRLYDAEEGTLASGSITGRTRHQIWTLNHTGNWELDRVDLDGDDNFNETDELNDDRTHNAVNEIVARDIDDDSSDDYTFGYDAAGNMTDDGELYTYEWDAFYRLRKVRNRSNSALVSEYWYNGLGYLITRHQDTDTDGDADGSDKKYHSVYDERWRAVSTFREADASPKESFVYHAAGGGGYGGSSYIDLVVLRDRDIKNGWTGAADFSLDERTYYCQNWRADVVALVGFDGAATMLEWVKYSAYGVPFGMPAGDADSEGDCDSADDSIVSGWVSAPSYDVRGDVDLDGDVDGTDYSAVTGGHQSVGRGQLSATVNGNHKGYAGYEFDWERGRQYHVRHRVLDSVLGRWVRRDPMGYVDGTSPLAYSRSRPIQRVDPSGRVSRSAVNDCAKSSELDPGELGASAAAVSRSACYLQECTGIAYMHGNSGWFSHKCQVKTFHTGETGTFPSGGELDEYDNVFVCCACGEGASFRVTCRAFKLNESDDPVDVSCSGSCATCDIGGVTQGGTPVTPDPPSGNGAETNPKTPGILGDQCRAKQ